jgi:hypothetical protein
LNHLVQGGQFLRTHSDAGVGDCQNDITGVVGRTDFDSRTFWAGRCGVFEQFGDQVGQRDDRIGSDHRIPIQQDSDSLVMFYLR